MGRESSVVLHRALSSAKLHRHQQPEGYVLAALAQKDLWFGCFQSALGNAIRAGLVADRSRFERDIARAARTHGEASLWMGDHETALERLSFAMAHARAVNFVEEEISALTALAERHRQRKELQPAYELLNQVWDAAEHGPYLLLHTDALNVLAHIERDQGNDGAAIVAATKAYELAWCDGISTDGKVCYAYHHGLTIARKHLRELGAPEPHLAPFVESEFDPLPNVELNPKDEFWVDPKILDSNL
jgi:tetratricopeptide (TPR) repeat protein